MLVLLLFFLSLTVTLTIILININFTFEWIMYHVPYMYRYMYVHEIKYLNLNLLTLWHKRHAAQLCCVVSERGEGAGGEVAGQVPGPEGPRLVRFPAEEALPRGEGRQSCISVGIGRKGTDWRPTISELQFFSILRFCRRFYNSILRDGK